MTDTILFIHVATTENKAILEFNNVYISTQPDFQTILKWRCPYNFLHIYNFVYLDYQPLDAFNKTDVGGM